MSYSTLRGLLIVLPVVGVACSGNAVEPSPGSPATSTEAQAPAGSYTLRFFTTGGVEVTSLPVLTELVLRAHVEDSSGQAAETGSVTFEYCSHGGRPNNVNDPDEAPLSDCAAGTARWKSLS